MGVVPAATPARSLGRWTVEGDTASAWVIDADLEALSKRPAGGI